MFCILLLLVILPAQDIIVSRMIIGLDRMDFKIWGIIVLILLAGGCKKKPVNIAARQRPAGATTPLHVAANAGDIEQIQLLISRGAEVNVKDKFGETPLHIAADKGYKNIAELLIINGANVNASDEDGYTPLLDAILWRHKDIVELLIGSGADVNAKPNKGTTLCTTQLGGVTNNWSSFCFPKVPT